MNCAVHTQIPATAYCRTCGKALCEECKRDVMGAIYCEPCIAARLHGAPGAAAPRPDVPNPVVAGVLGFLVPGVGAWYNGQFAKGFVHVLIFATLIAASAHINGLFGILVGLFPVYMGFEAYSTAQARRLGQTPPDPLGLDHLLGVETQPGTQAAPKPDAAGQPASSNAQPIAAFVLIGLGTLFLMDSFNLIHHVGRIVVPAALIGLGAWIMYKRTSAKV